MTFRALASMYSPYETCDGVCVNALGRRPTTRSVACPRRYPLGTRFRLDFPEGWEDLSGTYLCDDRTALKHDGRFDVFSESHATAVRFGLRIIDVQITE